MIRSRPPWVCPSGLLKVGGTGFCMRYTVGISMVHGSAHMTRLKRSTARPLLPTHAAAVMSTKMLHDVSVEASCHASSSGSVTVERRPAFLPSILSACFFTMSRLEAQSDEPGMLTHCFLSRGVSSLVLILICSVTRLRIRACSLSDSEAAAIVELAVKREEVCWCGF